LNWLFNYNWSLLNNRLRYLLFWFFNFDLLNSLLLNRLLLFWFLFRLFCNLIFTNKRFNRFFKFKIIGESSQSLRNTFSTFCQRKSWRFSKCFI
jgi:hypothetical protein